jgi:hypothetical protein
MSTWKKQSDARRGARELLHLKWGDGKSFFEKM